MSISMSAQMQSIMLQEHQGNETMTSWIYPIIDQVLEDVIKKRTMWNVTHGGRAYAFSRFKNTWHYILTSPTTNKEATPHIQSFAIAISSSVFNPEKYLALLHVIANRYASTGDPIQILEVYLAVFTTGQYQGPEGELFQAEKYKDTFALIESSSIKDLVNSFGIESVILWNALLQKKRIVVVDDSLPRMFRLIRALPQLVWHRQNWNLLRPLCTLSEEEIKELTTAGIYIAGFVDPLIKSRQDLWDVLIDGAECTITIADHSAKEDLKMGSLHKSVATLLMEGAQDEAKSEQDLIKALAIKTREVINQLRSDFGGQTSSAKDLIQLVGESDIPGSMKRFVIALALAEGFMTSPPPPPPAAAGASSNNPTEEPLA